MTVESMNPERALSRDGTSLAYETAGDGPALILIGGAFCDRRARASGTPLAALLAPDFRVLSYDRRGRGDSGANSPYSMQRELEDLDALIAAAGGRASLFGISSGGLLALEAAAHALPVERVVSYEAPLLLDDARRPSLELALALEAPTAAGRRADAAELFLTRVVGMPPAVVGAMKQAPHWHGLEMLAHTLSHDVRITAAAPQLLARLPSVSTPVFVLDGSASPPWLRGGGIALARAAPNGRHRTLEGQTHDVQPVALAAALRELLTEETPHGAPELSPGGSRAAKPGNVG